MPEIFKNDWKSHDGEEHYQFHATQTLAMKHARELRQEGIQTEVSKITTKKMPIKELMANIANQQTDWVEEVNFFKTVEGLKSKQPKAPKEKAQKIKAKPAPPPSALG